jgi:PAS domain S-box-containing protein
MIENNDLNWLSGGGEMGKLIRSMDWSQNTLGPVNLWPQSLKTAVSLCLSSTFPINIVWGPDHIQIYNDAYRPICGALHPASMGSKFKECWASALPVVGGAFDRGLAGEGTYIENQQMMLDRFGYLEEAFMTFSFGPIRDESGKVGGIFHPITESTEKMLSSRRNQIIRDLGLKIAQSKTIAEILQTTLLSQQDYELDLPFLFFFEVSSDGTLLFKATDKTPFTFSDARAWRFDDTADIFSIEDLQSCFGNFNCGPYEEAPRTAVVLPITAPGSDTPLLYVVAGVSARRALDSAYMSFFEMLKSTISTAINNVRAYEEELKRAEALAQIDKAKTAFFSNVSHEFRTPLTLILGPLEDSLTDDSNPLNDVQQARQEVIQRNSLRLLKLVNSLLDFSRIEAGRLQAKFIPVNLATHTAELASIFRSTIEKAGLELKIECDPMPENSFIDKEMWEKIVFNLLSNAFKFTFEGSVTVRVQWVKDGAQLLISDTGIGVNEEELPRLFERFHRVQGAKSRSYEGTGIGLALVQELVHMHGGRITVESALGRGTSFKIFIPAGSAHLPAEKVEASAALESTSISAQSYIQEAEHWSGMTQTENEDARTSKLILLADDNSDMRAYVTSILSSHWNVISAKGGAEAFQLALSQNPDLILTDVMMPVLDGFGFLKKIRETASLRSTPTVLLSARAGEEAKVEGLAAGADDYLVKPFSAKELVSRIHGLLDLNDLRYQANLELEENAEKFRTTFAHTAVNISMIALDGTILEVNEAYLRRTGFTADEVVGQHLSKITHDDDKALVMELFTKLSDGSLSSKNFDRKLYKKDGTFVWVQTSLSTALGADGKPLYVIGISQDIEARKRVEDDLQVAVRTLQEEKALREKFVATLTHDLRSPMTSVKMSAQILQRKPENSEMVQSQAARIVSNVNRADQMIQDLLDANKLRAGEKLPLVFEECNLNTLISERIDNYITLYGDRFLFESNEDDFFGHWSRSSMIRVIENLINNAVKYGDPHGTIHVRALRLNERVEISVHNMGHPIEAAELEMIFEPYKRSSDAQSGKHRGWGLGLTIVRGVTELMGGTVSVESNTQAGTTFTIRLPIDAREYYSHLH